MAFKSGAQRRFLHSKHPGTTKNLQNESHQGVLPNTIAKPDLPDKVSSIVPGPEGEKKVRMKGDFGMLARYLNGGK